MYLAMDNFGDDYYQEIRSIDNLEEKWRRIFDIASDYGFSGVQLDQAVYEEQLALPLKTMPSYFNKFRLTYHISGVSTLISEESYNILNDNISKSLEISDICGIEDVSFHPPLLDMDIDNAQDSSKKKLSRLIEYWLPKFQNKKITLSIESHFTPNVFIFDGLNDYHDFVKDFNDLGVLIDISHDFNDKYNVEEIINKLDDLKITGLHLSDAFAGIDFHNGTHLPIGKGNVDFKKIIQYFADRPDLYGALEIKGSSEDISESINTLYSYLKLYSI